MMTSWRSWRGRFAARLVAASAQKPKTLVVFGLMIDSPPAHPDTNNYACESREGSQQFWDAGHQHHSRPPTVSDCMPSPMERSSALDQRHTSPGYDAHS